MNSIVCQHKLFFEKDMECNHKIDKLIILKYIDRHIPDFNYKEYLCAITGCKKDGEILMCDNENRLEAYNILTKECSEQIKIRSDNIIDTYFLILFQELLVSCIDENLIYEKDSVDGMSAENTFENVIKNFEELSKISSTNPTVKRIKKTIKNYLQNRFNFKNFEFFNTSLKTFVIRNRF